MINFTQYEARDVFIDFVNKHKTNSLPFDVEGTKWGFNFPTRQNCIFFFEISPTCKKYGGIFIELIIGLLNPAVEKAIDEGETTFYNSDLIHFLPLEEAEIRITFDIRDYRCGPEALRIKQVFAQNNGLEPDFYIGEYPDGTKTEACGLIFKRKGIRTIHDLKRTLDSYWEYYYSKFRELAKVLEIDD